MKSINIIFTTSVIIFTVFTVSSCRTFKRQAEQHESYTQRQYANQQVREMHSFRFMDSVGSYWHFSTDSVFYYHPDSGLRARQGQLSRWDNRLHQQEWYSATDSNRSLVTAQEQYSSWKVYLRKVNDSKWSVLIGFLLFLGLSYLLYYYIRIKRHYP